MKRTRRTNRATMDDIELTSDLTKLPIADQYLKKKKNVFLINFLKKISLCHFKSSQESNTSHDRKTHRWHKFIFNQDIFQYGAKDHKEVKSVKKWNHVSLWRKWLLHDGNVYIDYRESQSIHFHQHFPSEEDHKEQVGVLLEIIQPGNENKILNFRSKPSVMRTMVVGCGVQWRARMCS